MSEEENKDNYVVDIKDQNLHNKIFANALFFLLNEKEGLRECIMIEVEDVKYIISKDDDQIVIDTLDSLEVTNDKYTTDDIENGTIFWLNQKSKYPEIDDMLDNLD